MIDDSSLLDLVAAAGEAMVGRPSTGLQVACRWCRRAKTW